MDELSSVLEIAPRPSIEAYAEVRFRDPEANALDLSQTKGWEVDTRLSFGLRSSRRNPNDPTIVLGRRE